MLLGCLYCNLNQCVHHDPISKLGGAFWFLQICAFAYFPGVADFLVGPPTVLIATSLMGNCLSMFAPDFMAYLLRLTVGDLSLPPSPNTHYLTQPLWVTSYSNFQDHSPDAIVVILLIQCIHRFLIVDCSSTRPPYDNSSWSFEFYNPFLYSYQFGLIILIPHAIMFFPMDITHLASEIMGKSFSKATVQLLYTLPSQFISPLVKVSSEVVDSFSAWWKDKYLALVPSTVHLPSMVLHPYLFHCMPPFCFYV